MPIYFLYERRASTEQRMPLEAETATIAELCEWKPSMRLDEVTINKHVSDSWLARAAIGLTAGLNLVLVNDLALGPRWLAPAFEIAMLVPLSIATARTHDEMRRATTEHHWRRIFERRRLTRNAALLLTALVMLVNIQALVAVVQALIGGPQGATGQSLLLDALNIWFTNIVIFALWFWELDRGGPALRGMAEEKPADFLFPQMKSDTAGTVRWTPGFLDYFYLSFTNAAAFSPTDTLPLTARSKMLMMMEAAISLLTVGLVAARAVNVLD